MPAISVVMPNYNGTRFVEEAIDSVLNQDFSDFELIVVDDCSTDHSLELVRKKAEKDARIRVIALEQNGGVARARNTGIREATGKYLAMIDNDDLWERDKLSRQYALLKESGAQIAYCSYDFIDENGGSIKHPFIVPEKATFQSMLVSSVISCSTVFSETSLMQEHPFEPDFYHEDYVLWMTLLKIPVRAVGDSKVLMHYRQVQSSRSHKKGNAAKQRWNIYRKYLKLNLFTSAVSFVRYAVLGVIKYR